MDNLIQKALSIPDTKPFLFQQGQVVRIKGHPSTDGQTPSYWDGSLAQVISYRSTLLSKTHLYTLKPLINNATDIFEEDELDRRYIRGEKNKIKKEIKP
jgi:hypothetical protein